MLLFQAPGGANAVVGKLGILVCSIPRLDYLVELIRLVVRAVELQPLPFDDDAGRWLWVLLVLSREIVLSHRAALSFQCSQG